MLAGVLHAHGSLIALETKMALEKATVDKMKISIFFLKIRFIATGRERDDEHPTVAMESFREMFTIMRNTVEDQRSDYETFFTVAFLPFHPPGS